MTLTLKTAYLVFICPVCGGLNKQTVCDRAKLKNRHVNVTREKSFSGDDTSLVELPEQLESILSLRSFHNAYFQTKHSGREGHLKTGTKVPENLVDCKCSHCGSVSDLSVLHQEKASKMVTAGCWTVTFEDKDVEEGLTLYKSGARGKYGGLLGYPEYFAEDTKGAYFFSDILDLREIYSSQETYKEKKALLESFAYPQEIEEKQILKIKKSIDSIKTKSAASAKKDKPDSIKPEDASWLKSYINDVLKLEIATNHLEGILLSIKQDIYRVQQTKQWQSSLICKSISGDNIELLKKAADLRAQAETLQTLSPEEAARILKLPANPNMKPKEPKPVKAVKKPTEPTYEPLKVLHRSATKAKNDAMRAKYEKSLNAYEQYQAYLSEKSEYDKLLSNYIEKSQNYFQQASEAASKRVALNIEEAKALEEKVRVTAGFAVAQIDAVLTLLLAEEKEVSAQLGEACSLLERAYSVNIIHAKYRNLPAISCFFEYFDTGRCTDLAGSDGAYNLFETELRFNTIIVNLDQIMEDVSSIKAGQHLLYTELKATNTAIFDLRKELGSMSTILRSVNKNGINISSELDNAMEKMGNIEKDVHAAAHYAKATSYWAQKSAEILASPSFMVLV